MLDDLILTGLAALVMTLVEGKKEKNKEEDAENSQSSISFTSPKPPVRQWKCGCGTENNIDTKICSSCGKEKEEPKRVRTEPAVDVSGVKIDVDRELLARIEACETAKEVENLMLSAVEKCEKSNHAQYVLSLLAERAEQDGNVSSARTLARAFVKGGMQVYPLDRSAATACCPVCGSSQNSHRTVCLTCGVLFSK